MGAGSCAALGAALRAAALSRSAPAPLDAPAGSEDSQAWDDVGASAAAVARAAQLVAMLLNVGAALAVGPGV